MSKRFPQIITDRVFETNSSFYVKWRTALGVYFLFFGGLLRVLAERLGAGLSFYRV